MGAPRRAGASQEAISQAQARDRYPCRQSTRSAQKEGKVIRNTTRFRCGHPKTIGNTYPDYGNGNGPRCKICRRASARRRYEPIKRKLPIYPTHECLLSEIWNHLPKGEKSSSRAKPGSSRRNPSSSKQAARSSASPPQCVTRLDVSALQAMIEKASPRLVKGILSQEVKGEFDRAIGPEIRKRWNKRGW